MKSLIVGIPGRAKRVKEKKVCEKNKTYLNKCFQQQAVKVFGFFFWFLSFRIFFRQLTDYFYCKFHPWKSCYLKPHSLQLLAVLIAWKKIVLFWQDFWTFFVFSVKHPDVSFQLRRIFVSQKHFKTLKDISSEAFFRSIVNMNRGHQNWRFVLKFSRNDASTEFHKSIHNIFDSPKLFCWKLKLLTKFFRET